MKTNITICLDHELVHALRQEGNMSNTMNILLQGYLFGGNSKEGLKTAIESKENLLKKTQREIIVLKEKYNKKPKMVVRHV